jgi:hypothetical protein
LAEQREVARRYAGSASSHHASGHNAAGHGAGHGRNGSGGH